MNDIKILIADDQPLMRDGLKTIIDNEEDMTVVAVADNGMTTYEIACEMHPDIILMDIRMPFIDGVESTRMIKKSHPEIVIILLTTFDDDEYIVDALSFGANGYLLKSIKTDDLINCIRKSVSGVTIMDAAVTSKISKKLLGMEENSSTLPKVEAFSEREIEIMKMMVKACTNREIAKSYYITEGTVKNYITGIYKKLNTNDRKKAIELVKKLLSDIM